MPSEQPKHDATQRPDYNYRDLLERLVRSFPALAFGSLKNPGTPEEEMVLTFHGVEVSRETWNEVVQSLRPWPDGSA